MSGPRKPGARVAKRKAGGTPVRRWRTAAPKSGAQAQPAAERRPMRRTIRGGRPYFFDDPAIDKVLNMVVVLGSEVWTLRERIAAMEAVQVRRGGLAAGEVDAHEFSAEDESRLAAERKEFIDSLFRILQEQVEQARGRAAQVARSA